MRHKVSLVHAVSALALTAIAALVSAPAATADWFGAPNLNLPANLGFNCSGYPLYGLYPTGTTSCTWFTIAAFGETNSLRSNIVPQGIGFITAWRIRTGPGTGPMRLTIFKSLRAKAGGEETACCIGDDQSPVVTPPPNAVTTIPLARAIPVYNGPESATVESFDSIGISPLDARTTVPANYNASSYVNGAALFPYVVPGQERFGQPIVVNPVTGTLNLPTGELATRGFQVLLQAEWEPQAGLRAPASSVTVRNGHTLVPLVCRLDRTCIGTLRLQNVKPKGAVAASTTATYGTASFKILPGRRQSIRVVLSRAGRRLMSRYSSRQVWSNATLRLGSTPVVISMKLTLRRGGSR